MKKKKSEVVVDKAWVEETEEARRNYLLGKIFMNQGINVEAMKAVLYNIWKLSYGLEIKEVGDKIFVFQFDDAVEKDKVLARQSWYFNKALIVFVIFVNFCTIIR